MIPLFECPRVDGQVPGRYERLPHLLIYRQTENESTLHSQWIALHGRMIVLRNRYILTEIPNKIKGKRFEAGLCRLGFLWSVQAFVCKAQRP